MVDQFEGLDIENELNEQLFFKGCFEEKKVRVRKVVLIGEFFVF